MGSNPASHLVHGVIVLECKADGVSSTQKPSMAPYYLEDKVPNAPGLNPGLPWTTHPSLTPPLTCLGVFPTTCFSLSPSTR